MKLQNVQDEVNKLGTVVTDKISGFTGVVTDVAFTLQGNVSLYVAANTLDKDGNERKGMWLQAERCNLTTDKVMEVPEIFADLR